MRGQAAASDDLSQPLFSDDFRMLLQKGFDLGLERSPFSAARTKRAFHFLSSPIFGLCVRAASFSLVSPQRIDRATVLRRFGVQRWNLLGVSWSVESTSHRNTLGSIGGLNFSGSKIRLHTSHSTTLLRLAGEVGAPDA